MMDVCTLVGLNFLVVKSLTIRVFAAWLVMHLVPVVQLIYHKKNSKNISYIICWEICNLQSIKFALN